MCPRRNAALLHFGTKGHSFLRAESARRVLNGELASATGEDALREIIRLGSSAGGAQAKAVVNDTTPGGAAPN